MGGGGGTIDPGTIRERYKDTTVFGSFDELSGSSHSRTERA